MSDPVSHASKPVVVAGNAHFARRVRLAEDVRHARMLHAIAHRPAERRTGSFLTLGHHEYFARTLAARKSSERHAREFHRQKANLMLLQRLQQIQHKEQDVADIRAGRSAQQAEWDAHQRKHAEALRRLQSRPRVGSSLVFRKVNEASPLSPRNRRQWDASSSGNGVHSARDGGYRDTVFDRDPPPCDPNSLRERTRAAQDPLGRSGLQRQVAEERDRIERELARRWQSLDNSHARHPLDSEDRQWDGTIAAMVRDYEDDAGLGPDEEEQHDEDRRWSRAMDPENQGAMFGLITQRHRTTRPPPSHTPLSAPLDALSSQAITAAMAATAAAIEPNANDPDVAASAVASLADPETSRHRAIRARYVAEDEDDVELEDEEHSASLQRRAEEEKEETSHTAYPMPRAGSSRPPRGLYDLAMNPELDLGDEELEAWRLFQYEHAQRELMQQQHAPVPPSGPRVSRGRKGSARAISAASSSSSLRAASEYSAAASSSYATSAAYSAEAAAAAADDYQDDIDSVLHMLNDDSPPQSEWHPQQQSQQPQRPRSRPSSAAREHRPPVPRPRPVSAAHPPHARSSSAQLRFASGDGSDGAAARPQPPSAYAGGAVRAGGGRHARTSSMAVRPSHAATAAAARNPPHSSHPPLPPRDPVASALALEHRHRLSMDRAAAEEAERYFASIEADFPSSRAEWISMDAAHQQAEAAQQRAAPRR